MLSISDTTLIFVSGIRITKMQTTNSTKHKTKVVLVTPYQLLKEYEAGLSTGDLARKYHVSRQRIHQLLKRTGEPFKNATDKQKREERHYAAFIEIVKQQGFIPSLKEMKKHGDCVCLHYYEFRKKAQKEGYVYRKAVRLVPLNTEKREALLNHIKLLAQKLGYTPSKSEIEVSSEFSTGNYIRYFGTISNAQKLAGLKPNKRGHQSGRKNISA